MQNLSFLAVYLAGVATSFTPCVYPLLPIIISYIGTQAEETQKKKILLTLFYVFGTSLTYAVLGLVASLTGKVFGMVQNSFIVNFLVSIICLFFSLSMFGLFNLSVQLSNFIKPQLFKGYLGGFMLGATSGAVFSPCTTPVLGTILTIVATKQNIVFGSLLLFVFALGLSTTIFLAGVFTGFLTKLPKKGKWMLVIERLSALVLLLISLLYLYKAVRLIL
ncbi:MAG: sulfite exporter TauE/SafE family protein [Endomicrobia bacterium]|nr:sulfite exporter TauE/SafE family protein [Endomicrobiia bacterium]MDW8056334.1 cytochrome c biogenesis protein CcdA [Elusimicrobiota bacterium]